MVLARWLVEQFARNHADEIFRLISKHNIHLHPSFWYELGMEIGRYKETPWDKDILSRWISLILYTVHEYVATGNQVCVDIKDSLYKLVKRCIDYKMLDDLLQIFDTMAGSRLRLGENSLFSNDDENNEIPPVNAELPMIGELTVLNDVWENSLKPKLSKVAEPLLDRVIRHLEAQSLTLRNWGNADLEREPASNRRFAIEPHDRNKPPQAIDVLIDAARDCLEWLVSNQAETAAQWCDRHVCSNAPLLRRLAVHGASKRGDLTADDKIDWLLTHSVLHESPIHYEVFQAVRQAYPEVSPERRETLIEDVWAYCWPNAENPDRKITARQHFDWFHCLHKSDPNCSRAKQALEEVSEKYPDFKPREYPNRTHQIRSGSVAPQSPWSTEELLEKRDAVGLNDLLSFQVTEESRPDYRKLKENFVEAAEQSFNWSLDLAKALDKTEHWDVYVWSVLIDAWSGMALNEDRHRQVLHGLAKPSYIRNIAVRSPMHFTHW